MGLEIISLNILEQQDFWPRKFSPGSLDEFHVFWATKQFLAEVKSQGNFWEEKFKPNKFNFF